MADFGRMAIGGFPAEVMTASSPSFGASSIASATDGVEVIFRAEEAAVITRLGFRYTLRTGTPPVQKIGLQGVDLTTGNPDGVYKGGGSPASATFTPPASTAWDATWQWVNLANAYTCTRGELLAWTLYWSSGPADASNKSAYGGSVGSGGYQFPYLINVVAGVRTRSFSPPCWGYGSAAKAYGRPAQASLPVAGYNSGTTPDELALKFTLPATWGASYRVAGFRAGMRLDTAAKLLTVKLYDGTTILQSVDVDHDVLQGLGNNRLITVPFTDATLATLLFGNTYRLGFQPQDTANTLLFSLQVAAAADWDAWPGGQNFALSTRTDAGAWTDVPTQRPNVELILDDWTVSAGGLRTPRGMTGGYSG